MSPKVLFILRIRRRIRLFGSLHVRLPFGLPLVGSCDLSGGGLFNIIAVRLTRPPGIFAVILIPWLRLPRLRMPAGRPGPFLVQRLLERARDDGLRRRSSRHHLRHRRDLLPYVARLGLRQADHIRGRRKRRRLRLRAFRPGRRTGPPGSSSGAPAPAVPGPRAVRATAATSAPFSLGAPHMERKTPRTGEHDFSGRQPS